MTDHITAAELRERASAGVRGMAVAWETFRRAAAALDAKDARIAELEGELMRRDGWELPERVADAELGALVREIRDHPEAKLVKVVAVLHDGTEAWDRAQTQSLPFTLKHLDSLAASREAEQGVEGPSGDRFRWKYGALEWQELNAVSWKPVKHDSLIEFGDIPMVAALIERHGGNDAN